MTLPDGAQTHGAPVRGVWIAARSGNVNADTTLAIRIDRNDNETLALCEAMVRLETEVIRGACSAVSRPPVEGRGGDKQQSAEAAAG